MVELSADPFEVERQRRGKKISMRKNSIISSTRRRSTVKRNMSSEEFSFPTSPTQNTTLWYNHNQTRRSSPPFIISRKTSLDSRGFHIINPRPASSRKYSVPISSTFHSSNEPKVSARPQSNFAPGPHSTKANVNDNHPQALPPLPRLQEEHRI